MPAPHYLVFYRPDALPATQPTASKHCRQQTVIGTHTHTHTRLTALCPGLPGWAGTRKVKPTWILLKQETVSGSEIRWAICRCPSCRPTNSVKALKAKTVIGNELEFGVIVKINVDVKRLAVTTAFWSEEVLVKRSVHAHRCTYAQP